MIDKIVKLPDDLMYYVLDELIIDDKFYFFLVQVDSLNNIVSDNCVVCEGIIKNKKVVFKNIEDNDVLEKINNIFISKIHKSSI